MGAGPVVVVGAGVGGLVAAIKLAASGLQVTLLERAAAAGGKIREVALCGRRLDAGPTVFTLPWVFEEIFAEAGADFREAVTLRRLEILARHAWGPEARLDLFADRERSADAIGRFAGTAEAGRYNAFCERARGVYNTLEQPFLRARRPTPFSLVAGAGLRGAGDLWQIKPFETLWRALGGLFQDRRLRQLFGRYATYCGSSPFQAPATLMLVAHVEQEGVWSIEGGMQRLADALARLAEDCGVTLRLGAEAAEVVVAGGRVAGVTLKNGERIPAQAAVVNADAAAVAGGLFGREAAQALRPLPRSMRSLSAVTWNAVAEARGFALARHNVFFCQDYAAEFDDIFRQGRLPRAPTVYVCAQDRDDASAPDIRGAERLLCLVNAPPSGDSHPFDRAEIERCKDRSFELMARCGLEVTLRPEATLATSPRDFAERFPATGGALYGQASHGWRASFRRPGSRTRVPGLYLAGGSTHPGPGVPMAALSGRLAAESLLADLASRRPSRQVAMPGGMSMR